MLSTNVLVSALKPQLFGAHLIGFLNLTDLPFIPTVLVIFSLNKIKYLLKKNIQQKRNFSLIPHSLIF